MDEFDFDNDSSHSLSLSSKPSSLALSASSSPFSHSNNKRSRRKRQSLDNSNDHRKDDDDDNDDQSSLLQNDTPAPPTNTHHQQPPPLRGRTKARRSRQVLRTGADALQNAQHRTLPPTPRAMEDMSSCSSSYRRTRTTHDPTTLSTHDDSHSMEKATRSGRRHQRRRRCTHRPFPTDGDDTFSVIPTLPCPVARGDGSTASSERAGADVLLEDDHGCSGRIQSSLFHKSANKEEDVSDGSVKSSQRRARSDAWKNAPRDGNDPDSGTVHSPLFHNKDASHCSLQHSQTNTMTETLHNSSPEDKDSNPYSTSIHSPFPSSQGSNRSVRFSLSSNTRHFYPNGYYGTPPGSPQQIFSKSPCLEEARYSENDTNGLRLSSKECNGFTNGNRKYPHWDTATQQSTKDIQPTDKTDEHDTASHSNLSSQTDTPPKKKRPRSCLKAATYPSQTTAASTTTTTAHSSPSSHYLSSSSSSSSSYGSSTTIRKRHISRTNGHYFSDLSQNSSSSSHHHSPDETPLVTLGRHRDVSDVQDMGHYRLLVDDLSYFCSAILHCHRRDGVGGHHTSVTAGAACDLAEIVSKMEVQMALLMWGGGGKGGGVGALLAVLEAVACAPPVMDVMEICRDVIEGTDGFVPNDGLDCGFDGKEEEFVGRDGRGKTVEKPAFGRTKNARRTQGGGIETNGEFDSNNFVPWKSLEVRDKHDAISARALSIVAHFVSVLCTRAPAANSNIKKAAVKAARSGVLQHKAALQGLARLVADDPVVDAYLRREASAVNGVDPATNNDGIIANTATEIIVDDDSAASFCTSSSRSSNLSSFSNTNSAGESNTLDPTKFGRRKSRKKKSSRTQQSIASSCSNYHLLEPISEVDKDIDEVLGIIKCTGDKSKETDEASKSCNESNDRSCVGPNGKSECLDFLSEDGSMVSRSRSVTLDRVELKSDVKYQEKIASALSRANLRPTIAQAILASDMNALEDEEDWICAFCTKWEQNMLVSSDTEYPSYSSLSSASVALDAVDLIICGRDKSIPPNDDDEHSEDEDDADNFLQTSEPDKDEVSENPMLLTNEMMRKSDTLPDYSRSMASTLASILLWFRQDKLDGKAQTKKCNKCITYLQHRASMLSGIIDNLCCLSPEATKALSCPKSLLIPSLLRVVSEIHFNQDTQSTCIEECALASLKTLTTLTHENSTACHQIIAYCKRHPTLCVCSSSNATLNSLSCVANGVEIIFSILFKTITEMTNDKSGYDTTIFCLNILTNIAETIPSSTREIFLGLLIKGEVKGISWLTQWIVSKTSGFQSAVMKGTFGSTRHDDSTANNDSELKPGEEGNLVTSGNGFVLLSYLMLDDNNGTTTSQIRDIIVRELPIDETGNSGGIQFMIKTLKAFCNFYHYSVGDLSVAVIAPVIRLIAGLEKIHLTEQSKKWL
ncbi:hypothetical protein HJC23_000143 [Cyclotella cryptica]|uniref:Wings apart-like protein C-terminal domain-containing protein n=1 Tax=Cyclotella cryptica TaxID=29204 RepID=A0ABD3PJF7_9STRA|eukprot:CCRYP_014078-RA/>CCRYP_014078-RA protein AED:0.06 eAED:0.06 QI:267/-1/1/1/-1/1/1/191/1415